MSRARMPTMSRATRAKSPARVSAQRAIYRTPAGRVSMTPLRSQSAPKFGLMVISASDVSACERK